MILKMLKGKSSDIKGQLIRYAISGGIAFVVDYSTFYLLHICLGVNYILSSVISNGIGLVITYLLSILWIFDKRSISNRSLEFTIFIIIGVVGLTLTALFMWLFTEVMGIPPLYSKLITVVVTSGINFVLKKLLLFSNKNNISTK